MAFSTHLLAAIMFACLFFLYIKKKPATGLFHFLHLLRSVSLSARCFAQALLECSCNVCYDPGFPIVTVFGDSGKRIVKHALSLLHTVAQQFVYGYTNGICD